MDNTPTFSKVTLYTGPDGRARFREESIPLGETGRGLFLSALMSASGLQMRQSPVGYRSNFHCSTHAQWLFVLKGALEISLQDGSSRVFRAGDCLYSEDFLPAGATFDPAVHGHRSRLVGDEPLVTIFVRV